MASRFPQPIDAGLVPRFAGLPTFMRLPAVTNLTDVDIALVGELTVIDHWGRPVTYPLIPLSDGNLIYLTSSVLFSRTST